MTEDTLNQEGLQEESEGLFDDISVEDANALETQDSNDTDSGTTPSSEGGENQNETNPDGTDTNAEGAAAGGEGSNEGQTPSATPFSLKVKYNGEEKDLSEEEAREMAQKGLNYDKVKGQLGILTNRLDELARANGMDIDTFLNKFEETQIEFETNKEKQALRQQFPDTDEKVLDELAHSRVVARMGAKIAEIQNARNAQDNAREQEIKSQIAMFRKEYPDKEVDKLDPHVYEFVKQGYSLLEAYNKWAMSENAKAREEEAKKLAIAKQNESNKSKNLGNIDNNGSQKVKDDFMEGWNSED